MSGIRPEPLELIVLRLSCSISFNVCPVPFLSINRIRLGLEALKSRLGDSSAVFAAIQAE